MAGCRRRRGRTAQEDTGWVSKKCYCSSQPNASHVGLTAWRPTFELFGDALRVLLDGFWPQCGMGRITAVGGKIKSMCRLMVRAPLRSLFVLPPMGTNGRRQNSKKSLEINSTKEKKKNS